MELSEKKSGKEIMSELQEWANNLTEVEAKLSRFELNITNQESTLSTMLSDCDSLLKKLAVIPDPEDETILIELKEDEDDETEYLEELVSESNMLESECLIEDFGLKDYEESEETKQLRRCIKSLETQEIENNSCLSMTLAAGEHCIASGAESNDGAYLCEFCGKLLNSNDLFQQHLHSCLWAD